MKRTPQQNKGLYRLLGMLNIQEEERGVLVNSFTDGRTSSTKEMTMVECQALINFLGNQLEESVKKMRAKAINIALDIGLLKPHPNPPQTGRAYVASWEPMNKWTMAKWKQPFYKLSNEQLRNCVTALENWRDGETQKMVKEILQ